MKKFEILRYLKRFSILVFLIAILGVGLTWGYVSRQQKYTATTVIQYLNPEIADGLAPDGTEMDVNEIYSSTVISQAMSYLGQDGPLNIIRSRCNVEEIISSDQKTINEAILDKGESITYFPDTYQINLMVDGKYGGDYARNALDAIVESYCTYYTEKYVEQRLSLTPSANLLADGYDYYECIRILEDDTDAMIDFLKKKKDDYPNFRSSMTGYSYADLYEIYLQFKNYTLPELYAKTLKVPLVRDGAVLKNHLANDIANLQHNALVQGEQREKLLRLIDNFVDKNLGMPGEVDDGDTIESDYILDQIAERGSGANAETTYDGLILEIVSIDKNIAREEIDRDFTGDVLSSFSKVTTSSGTAAQHAQIEGLIDDYERELSRYYEIVSATGKELNSAISTDYLKMISTVRVYPSINAKLYIAIAFVLFFVVGCAGAILLGRLEDIILYMLYTDRQTGLPNRDKLNLYIGEHAEQVLPEDFSCIAIRLDNLAALNKRFGYSVGNSVLRDFADIIRVLGDSEGVVGYNGVGNYNIFFEKCSEKKAAVILRILSRQVEIYNNAHAEYPIEYRADSETTTSSGIYDIRELLRAAIRKLQLQGEKKEGEKA